jgi:hypothetical protein
MMKKILVPATIFIILTVGIQAAAQTAAQPSGHESHGTQEAAKSSPPASGQESHTGHDAAKPSPAADAIQPNAHDHAASGKHARMMDAQMKKMQTLMEKIRATTDPRDLVDRVGFSGQHDHRKRCRRGSPPDHPADLHPRDFVHHQVEQHERPLRLDRLPGLPAVVGLQGRKPFLIEVVRNQLHDILFVIGDEDPFFALLRSPLLHPDGAAQRNRGFAQQPETGPPAGLDGTLEAVSGHMELRFDKEKPSSRFEER